MQFEILLQTAYVRGRYQGLLPGPTTSFRFEVASPGQVRKKVTDHLLPIACCATNTYHTVLQPVFECLDKRSDNQRILRFKVRSSVDSHAGAAGGSVH